MAVDQSEEIFRFVGLRVPLAQASSTSDPVAIAETGAPGFERLVATDEQLHVAVRTLADQAGVRLATVAEAESPLLLVAASFASTDLTTQEVLARLKKDTNADISTSRASDAYRRDRYRAAVTTLAVHYDLYNDLEPDWAMWVLSLDGALETYSLNPSPDYDKLPFVDIVQGWKVSAPPKAAAPSKALARDPAIGDLFLVRQRLTGYHLGEIAAIENVMATETREHRIGHKRVDEQVDVTTTEQETTSEQETSLNSRNEVQNEVSKVLTQQFGVHGDVRVESKLGPTTKLTADVGGSFSSTSSEATKSASTFAQETTERALKVVREKKTSSRRITARTETTDFERRAFSNQEASNVVGLYRWVESEWEATLHNYGRRLLLEFLVPEPGIWLSSARRAKMAAQIDLPEPHAPTIGVTDAQGKPVLDANGNQLQRPLFLSDLEPWNYSGYVAAYLVQGVDAPPSEQSVGGSIRIGDKAEDMPPQNAQFLMGETLKIPDGYEAVEGHISILSWGRKNIADAARVGVSIGGKVVLDETKTGAIFLEGASPAITAAPGAKPLAFDIEPPVSGMIPVAAWADLTRGLVGTITLRCRPTDKAMLEWRQRTYERIAGAYVESRQAYESRVAAAKVEGDQVEAGTVLNLTRSHIMSELKKHVIGMLNPGRVTSGDPLGLDELTDAIHVEANPWVEPVAQPGRDALGFLEQAIEWTTLQYVTYPYFWGDRTRWSERFADSFEHDYLGEFLGAGAARVVVAVPYEFSNHMLYYLDTGKPWSGGKPPTPGNPTYVSIAQELQERTDNEPPSPALDTWNYSLPTNLVMLQADAALPSFPAKP